MHNLWGLILMGSKKVFFTLPSLGGGGAEKIMIQLANIFSSKGFDTSIVLLTNNNDDYLQFIHPQVKLIRLNKKRVLFSILALRNIFKTHKPDVILSTLIHTNVLSIVARFLSGVYSFHFL